MKKAIPIILTAALILTGCKGKNSETSADVTTEATTAATSSAVTSKAVTTAETTQTKTTSAASTETDAEGTTATVSPEEAALIEDGIIPPEIDDTPAETESQPQFSVEDDDAPIELPMIPIV